MFDFIMDKKNSITRSIGIPAIGALNYYDEPERFFWFGVVDTIVPDRKIELSIEPDNGTEISEEQIRLVQDFPADYNYYINMLFAYLESVYDELTLEAIKEMYFLAAIELKKYNSELHFTLEPNLNVQPKYDHFQRFIIVDKMITWSNISLE